MAAVAKGAARIARNRLFISRIHWTISEHVLKSYFEEFGPVIYTSIAYDKNTGLSKHYGFIVMKKEADYQRALAQKRHIIEGYPMVVARCARYGKQAWTAPHSPDDVGTPLDVDGFEGGGDVDVASGNEEDTRTPQLNKESNV